MSFASYILKKVSEAIITIFIAVTLAFFLFRFLPGDPTAVFLDVRLTPEAKLALQKQFGLDKPLYEQYFLFIYNLLQGNLGYSFAYRGMPVSELIFGPKLVNTLVLMGSGMVIGAVLSTILGLIVGWKRGSILDRFLTSASYALSSAPIFWIGLLVLLVLGSYLNLIPMGGTLSIDALYADPLTRALNYLHHLVGPLIVIVLYFLPIYMLYVRNTIVSLLGEPFVELLKAKGLSSKTIVIGHLSKYALLTSITLLAVQSPLLVTGAIITETVFGWNGIGLLLYESVLKSDYPVVQGIFIITIAIVVVANLLADIAYAYIDPRIRRG